jgi:hypothetical protein
MIAVNYAPTGRKERRRQFVPLPDRRERRELPDIDQRNIAPAAHPRILRIGVRIRFANSPNAQNGNRRGDDVHARQPETFVRSPAAFQDVLDPAPESIQRGFGCSSALCCC